MSQCLRAVSALLLAALLAACSGGEVVDTRLERVTAANTPEQIREKALTSRVAVAMTALNARPPDLERARKHLSRALEIDPDFADAHNAMAIYYSYEGDAKREEEHYRKAIRANGNFSQARNNYAVMLYRQGRYADAIEQLERAADDPNYDQRHVAWLNLGRCYAKVGKLDKAVAAYQRALRLDSSQADALIELADVYLEQGNLREARNYHAAYAARTRQTARSLWIGIRVESALGDKDKVASYEFQLAKMYRNSPEFSAWQSWKSSGSPAPAAGKGEAK